MNAALPRPTGPAQARLARLALLARPRRLRHQVLGLLAAVLALAMLALYAVSTRRAEASAFESSRRWAEAVARTAASASAQPLARHDPLGLESALGGIAQLPGVLRIDVVEPDGFPLLALRSQPGGVVARHRPKDLKGPDARQAQPEPQVLRVAGIDALQVWAPVDPLMPMGRIGVLVDPSEQRDRLLATQRESIAAFALVGLLALGVMWLFLRRALAPLQRVARFSRSLGSDVGSTLHQDGSSQEVADLTDALNDASLTLRAQLDALQSGELRVHAILAATPDAILSLDHATRITLINPAATSIFGVEMADIDGRELSALLPELTPARIDELTREGMLLRGSNSRMTRLDATALRRDGTEFPVEVAITRVDDADGPRYTCAVRDVTDQRWLDSMMRLYNRALECATNGVVISDITRPGHPIFYANPAFETITGYPIHEAIGRSCRFLQGDDTRQPEVQQLREAIAEGRSATVVLRNYRKDGTLFFNELSVAPVTDPNGGVTHYVGVQSDVTERERARFALAERSARLNAVFDLSPDGFVLFDRDGKVRFCNRAFLQMTGWDGAALTAGTSMDEFDARFRLLSADAAAYPALSLPHDDAEGFETVDLLLLERPRPRVLTRLLRHNAGGQGESILYFRDVTHETEVDRMKSEFLTTAAHELRTPMVSIFGFSELMLKRPVPPERQREVIETIHRQAALLVNMVNELLDLARIEARQGKDFQVAAMPLGPLIEETVEGLMVQGDPRKVELAIGHGDWVLMADHDKSRRAITNVLSNAYKYSPGGGPITLRTVARRAGERWQAGVCVQDRGIGMTPEQSARLFERFFRADPSGNIPGTGLGMSLVKEIMELQGGSVEVESELGVGTRVTLWFALARDNGLPALVDASASERA